jgi:hypothetical protein
MFGLSVFAATRLDAELIARPEVGQGRPSLLLEALGDAFHLFVERRQCRP